MTREALLAQPAEAAEPEGNQLGRIRDFIDLGAAALETWVVRFLQAQRILARGAQFDLETKEPLNEAAGLQLLIMMTVDEHLKWAITTLRGARELSAIAAAPPEAMAGESSGAGAGFPLGIPLRRPAGPPEARVLAALLSVAPKAGQAQLRAIYQKQTPPAQQLRDLLDAGVASMGFWIADLEKVAERLTDSEGDLSKSIYALCFDHLHPALLAAQATLGLTRPSEPPPERRDHDDGKSQAC